MTQIEVLLNAALHSISRDNILLNLTIGRSKAESVILKNGRGGYIAKISIGTPPVDSFVNIDTGSDLIWVQCRPCSDCFPQNSPIFDPSESSTYKTLPCDSLFCSSLASTANCAQNKCSYKYEYGEGSATIGDLSADIIGFGNDTAASLECAFGCGHQNTGFFSHMEAGILGLGDSYLSFASQLGKKIGHIFSYCFVPMTSNSAGKLIFGFQSTQPRVGDKHRFHK
ncbi:hypothetical protein VNO77_27828 [Canavalia gladiata]|uniref:Peptidase A1 domain-containing protein n=1 Tax=Canavalia gladiata TaxID=3824 RepID=A0AAN9KUU9_CANGL